MDDEMKRKGSESTELPESSHHKKARSDAELWKNAWNELDNKDGCEGFVKYLIFRGGHTEAAQSFC